MRQRRAETQYRSTWPVSLLLRESRRFFVVNPLSDFVTNFGCLEEPASFTRLPCRSGRLLCRHPPPPVHPNTKTLEAVTPNVHLMFMHDPLPHNPTDEIAPNTRSRLRVLDEVMGISANLMRMIQQEVQQRFEASQQACADTTKLPWPLSSPKTPSGRHRKACQVHPPHHRSGRATGAPAQSTNQARTAPGTAHEPRKIQRLHHVRR